MDNIPKRLLCLKWDIDNIEDLNDKRKYLSKRVEELQELFNKNDSLHGVISINKDEEDIIVDTNKTTTTKRSC